MLRVGTRTSPLAMAQARGVAERLERLAGVRIEVVGIQTSGDRHRGRLEALGGKGAFMREIDRALVEERVDVAVHCLKDVPGDEPRPEGLEFAAYLERDDTSDVMVFPAGGGAGSLGGLTPGARGGRRRCAGEPSFGGSVLICGSSSCGGTSTRGSGGWTPGRSSTPSCSRGRA
nr:hypothetical protein GCM10010200_028500 [Actinomadura rugatobispora]